MSLIFKQELFHNYNTYNLANLNGPSFPNFLSSHIVVSFSSLITASLSFTVPPSNMFHLFFAISVLNSLCTIGSSFVRLHFQDVFLRKGVLKIYSKFTGEHPCRSAISIKLQSKFIEIALWHGCSHVNLLYIFRTPYSKNTSGRMFLQLDFQNFEKLRCISVNHGQNLIVMKNSYCYFLDVIFASIVLKHCFEMISVSKFPKTCCKTQLLKQIKKHYVTVQWPKKLMFFTMPLSKLIFLRLFYIQNFLFSWILLHLYPKLSKLKRKVIFRTFWNVCSCVWYFWTLKILKSVTMIGTSWVLKIFGKGVIYHFGDLKFSLSFGYIQKALVTNHVFTRNWLIYW